MTDTASEPSLNGRTALITGASGGLGQAIGTRLAAAGVDLLLTYSGHREEAEGLAQQARELGRTAETWHADFSDPDAPADLARSALERFDAIDLLLPAAGAGEQTQWDEVDEPQWDAAMTINVRAPFFLAQRLMPTMIERGFGRVLLFSSIAALNGGVIGPHYAASKAALHGLTHHLASRVAASGVTVNALAPALIAGTRMLPADPDDDPPLPIPTGRYGTTSEVADLTLAILRNGYLTNKVLPLDGGLHPQ